MNQEMKDLLNWVIKRAQDGGASESAAQLYKSRGVNIRYRENKPEVVMEASTQNLTLEIYNHGKFSVQSTPDLRKTALEEFIKKQIDNTAYLGEDPFRSLPFPSYFEGRSDVDLQKTDPSYGGFSIEQRHEKVKAIEDACIEKGKDDLLTVTAEMQDTQAESITMTSNGFIGEDEGTRFSVQAKVTVKDEGDRKPNGYFGGTSRMQADLPGHPEIAEMTLRDALGQVGARKIPTEKLPVIIQNNSSPRIFDGFMSSMLGGNLQQKRSFLLDKKGQKVGSNILTLLDDPLLVKGLSSRLYDGDGFPHKKRTMIEAGILKEYYIDWYYSRKMECEPTTSGPSNLFIPPGRRSVQDIMRDLGRGILVTAFIGGNSNSTTGDFSVGIMGQMFDQGEIVQAISEMNIADNHLKFWHKLIEAADDPWKYGSFSFPSLVFEDIMVAGS
jgi:PmbA protein